MAAAWKSSRPRRNKTLNVESLLALATNTKFLPCLLVAKGREVVA